jgi:hypothetical protein
VPWAWPTALLGVCAFMLVIYGKVLAARWSKRSTP